MKQPYNFSKRLTDDTDIQDSQIVSKPQMRKYKRKRVPKYQRELKRLTKIANYIKIMRFRSLKLHKTLRVYCYDENTLDWPHRFAKKINKMVSDNDRDSDEQLIQEDKNRCLKSLFEALQEIKKTQGMKISQT